ncbi:MAG: hypothetical protein HDR27_00125, partial [Lachnospiraceae bacterium]|nr:hypothetical protein [Lachnospiraceae bacterium]
PLPYYVFLDRSYIRDVSEGAVAARVYTGLAAPEGESHFELVADDEGKEYDNGLFAIDGDTLKIGQALRQNASYTVCIQSIQDNETDVHSQKAVYTLKTVPTLEAVRREAALSLESPDDRMALDLDLAGHDFEEDGYLDLGAADSAWYEGGKYLKVLNNLREKTDGGTIIYRFRTTANNGLIFGSGSDANTNKTTMAFGLSNGGARGVFRALEANLKGNFNSEIKLNDGNWHTIAWSFDTTKADCQNQSLLSIDGHENIYFADWWLENRRTWFNQNQGDQITKFVVGGGTYTSDFNNSNFTSGNIAFVTITDQIYTEEELRLLTNMDWIEGTQALRLDGNAVTVPEGAAYTASPVVWDEDNAEAEFTLYANDGALFRDNAVSVSIVNGETLGSIDNVEIQYAEDSRSVNVRFSVSQWRENTVFEGEEITVKDGVSDDVSEILDEETIAKLNAMRRGSVTVRYKLDEATAEADGRRVLFSVSNGRLNGYSAFYVTPSTGAVGYSIRNQVSNASVTVNTDEAARENIKNQNWHTVTYVFNTSGTEIYLDGTRVLANKEVGFLRNTENVQYARIGSVYRGESRPKDFAFGGEINYIQVTYDVLNETEIKSLHAATAPKALALPEDAVKTEDMNLYEANGDDDSYYEMPSLLAMSGDPGRTIIAAADKRQTTGAEFGNIDTVVRRSTDNGKTWSEPRTVFNQPEGSMMSSFTTAPVLVEGKNGRIHMIANLFPESQGSLSTDLMEKGSGFKEVDGTLYPVLRNYGNTALNAEGTWTQEYTIREDGVVYEEMEDHSEATEYRVPNYLAANGGGDLYIGNERHGNIYVYTGENAGELKVPRVMSVVACYSDDNGETWEGYQNITGMIKKEWMKFMRVGSGAGIRLEHQTDESLNGRIVVPVCYTNGDAVHSYAAALIYSDDNGETWEMTDTPVALDGVDVEKDTFKDSSLRESSVVEMGDGTLKMFSSNYSGHLKMSTGAFGENGFEWTKVQETSIPDQGESVSVLHMNGKVDGKETILLLAPLGPGSDNGYIHMGLYQADGTFEWKYLRKIKEDDFGGSSMSMLDNGSVGILFKGNGQNVTFTSLNEKWLTSPRYEDFERPVIEEITIQRDGSGVTFTVLLDSAMMKKGNPVLKLKVKEAESETEAADAQAAYVSRLGLKEYVFRYDIGDKELESITAVNIAMSDEKGFIEGPTGLMPEDVAFSFDMGRDGVIADMKTALDDLKALYESDGTEYEETYWKAFQKAYEDVQSAYGAAETSGATANELSALLGKLQNAKKEMENHRRDLERERVLGEMKEALDDLKALYDSDGSEYEEAYWNAFKAAYDKVQEACDTAATSGATASALTGLLTELQTAKTELDSHKVTAPEPDRDTVIAGMKDVLDDLKALYDSDGSEYEEAYWNAFKAAYDKVQEAYGAAATSDATASELSNLLGELQKAKEDLDNHKAELDRDTVISDMNQALKDLEDLYKADGAGYDKEAWEEFEALYKEVENALKNVETSGASASELAALLRKLQAAKKDLDDSKTQDSETVKAQQAVNKALDDYKNTFDKLKANYTEATWKKFEDAYKAAQKAIRDGITDKEELERLEKELKEAFSKLVKVQNRPVVQKLTAPVITSLKAVAEKNQMGVKIQVGKVTNADIYTVYRAVGSSVKEIGRANASGVVYDQTPVSKKTVSYYAIAEASSGKYQKSGKGVSKTIKLDASVKKITAKQVKKKKQVRLSWKKVKNAQKYIVYRSMKKDSGYTKIKTLKKSAKTYVDKKVKKGKTYYYRIVIKTKKGYSGVTTSKKLKIKK